MNKTESIFINNDNEILYSLHSEHLAFKKSSEYISREQTDKYLLSLEDDVIKNDADNLKKDLDLENDLSSYEKTIFFAKQKYDHRSRNYPEICYEFSRTQIDFIDKVYLHIDFGREITNDDIIKLLDTNMYLCDTPDISNDILFTPDFKNSFMVDLLKGCDVFPDIGIIKLCILNFEASEHSFPLYTSSLYLCIDDSFSRILCDETKSIDVQVYGKKCNSRQMDLFNTCYTFDFWQYNNIIKHVKNGQKFPLYFGGCDYHVQFMSFYYYIDDNDFDSRITSIKLITNNSEYMNFDEDDLITLDIYNLRMYIICFDPKYRTIEKFAEYFGGDVHNSYATEITSTDQIIETNQIIGVNLRSIMPLHCEINFENLRSTATYIFIDYISSSIFSILNGRVDYPSQKIYNKQGERLISISNMIDTDFNVMVGAGGRL